MSWTCSLGWLRFTVPNGSAEEAMTLVGGDWVADEKGFLGYSRSWICRGHEGGLGRLGTGAKRAPKEVHVDLSQELISGRGLLGNRFERGMRIEHRHHR